MIETVKQKWTEGVFGGIHGVSSAVILFVPKLRLVWILWCKIGVVLCHKCLRQRTIWRTNEINSFLVQMMLRFLQWFSPPHQSRLRRLPPWICRQTLSKHIKMWNTHILMFYTQDKAQRTCFQACKI
jgi:hypothetical protein